MTPLAMHSRRSGSTRYCGTLARKTENRPIRPRRRVALADQVLGFFLQHLRAHVAAVFDHDREAAGPADAADRRRPEDGDLRLLRSLANSCRKCVGDRVGRAASRRGASE